MFFLELYYILTNNLFRNYYARLALHSKILLAFLETIYANVLLDHILLGFYLGIIWHAEFELH